MLFRRDDAEMVAFLRTMSAIRSRIEDSLGKTVRIEFCEWPTGDVRQWFGLVEVTKRCFGLFKSRRLLVRFIPYFTDNQVEDSCPKISYMIFDPDIEDVVRAGIEDFTAQTAFTVWHADVCEDRNFLLSVRAKRCVRSPVTGEVIENRGVIA